MPDNCKDESCPMLPRIEALERESAHNKDAHKEFYSKLEGSHLDLVLMNERTQKIKEDTEEIKVSVKELREDNVGIQDLKKDVEELKMKPAKRWENIVEKAIWAIAAAVIAFLLARVGL